MFNKWQKLKSYLTNNLGEVGSGMPGTFGGGNPYVAVFMAIGKAIFNFLTKPAVQLSLFVAQGVMAHKAAMEAKRTGADILLQKYGTGAGMPVIYGTRRVAGTVVYMNTTNNKELFVVYAIAGHEIDSFDLESLQIDGRTIKDTKIYRQGYDISDGTTRIAFRPSGETRTSGTFWGNTSTERANITGGANTGDNARMTFNCHKGANNQTADPMLSGIISEWTSDHKLSGITYIAANYEYDIQGMFTGIPNLTVVVNGKKVYDPRTTNTTFSSNPALCLLDYLTDDEYGKGLSLTNDIDTASFSTAANDCDVSADTITHSSIVVERASTTTDRLTIANANEDDYNAFKVGNKFTISDGVTTYVSSKKLIDKDSTLIDIDGTNPVATLQLTFESGAVDTAITSNTTCTFTETQIRFDCNGVLDTDETVLENTKLLVANMRGIFTYSNGKYSIKVEGTESSVVSLDEDDILESGITLSLENKEAKYNKVEAEFYNAQKKYETDTTYYTGETSDTFLSDDGNEVLETRIQLPFCTNQRIAYNHAKAMLKRSRSQKTISFVATPKVLKAKVGEVISVTNSNLNLSSEQYRITNMVINPDLNISVNAIEYQTAIYGYVTPPNEEIGIGQDPVDGHRVEAPSSLTFTNKNATTGEPAKLTWTDSSKYPSYEFRVQIIDGVKTRYDRRVKDTTFYLDGISIANGYLAKVSAINSLGVESDTTDITVNVTTAPITTVDIGQGSIGGFSFDASKMYHGTGTFNNTNTAVYIDDSGQFSLKDKLSFDGTTLNISGNLTVENTITADKIVVDGINLDNLISATTQSGSIYLTEFTGIKIATAGATNGYPALLRMQDDQGTNCFTDITQSQTGINIRARANTAQGTIRFQGIGSGITPVNYGGFDASGNFEIGTTDVIDASRNLTNLESISLADSKQLNIGSGPDLIQYHNGSNSFIQNFTGGLYIDQALDNGNMIFRNDNGSGGLTAYMTLEGGNERVSFNKRTIHHDNVLAVFGSDQDLQIYHNGTDSFIDDAGSGDLRIRSNFLKIEKYTGETMATFNDDNSVALYFNNSKKFETTSTGIDVTGSATISGDLTVNGTTTTLNTATLDVEDKNITLNYGAGDTSASANGAGITIQDAVNSTTDATILWDATNDEFDFSHGITLPDDKRLRFGAGNDLQILHNGTDSFITNYTSDLYITNTADDKDIIFRSDNGSGSYHTYFLLDGSNNKTQFNRHLKIIDNMQIQVGTAPDMLLYHDGTHSYIDNNTGSLYISSSSSVQIEDNSGNDMITAGVAGAVTLFHNGSSKLATTSTGIDVTGTAVVDGLTNSGSTTFNDDVTFIGAGSDMTWDNSADKLNFDDNTKATFGNSDDLQIYHDGSASYIDDTGTGQLILNTNGSQIALKFGSENMAIFGANDAVKLYYDSSKKFETTSTGIDVTGMTVTDGITSSAAYKSSGGNTGGSGQLINVGGDAVNQTNSGTIRLTEKTYDVSPYYQGAYIKYDGNLNHFKIGTHNASTNALSDDIDHMVLVRGTQTVDFKGAIQSGGTTIVDTSRNLTNIVNGTLTGTLDVSGNVTFFDETTSNNHKLTLQKVYNRESAIEWARGSDVDAKIRVDSSEDFIFEYNHSNLGDNLIYRSNSSEVARFNSSGNFGIGTTSPTEKLSLVGGDLGIYGSTSGGLVTHRTLHFHTSEGTASLSNSNKQVIGEIAFSGHDSSLNAEGKYAHIKSYVIDANSQIQGSANEGGQLEFTVLRHDVSTQARVEHTALTIDNSAKVGIGTTDPDGQGYSYAEDLVILGGASASDGVGITLRGNGKRYGVIAFGDNANDNEGEIWYDHNANSMNFRTANILQVTLGSTGNLDVKNGDLKIGNTSVITSARNLTNIGTISSGAITASSSINLAGELNFTGNGNKYIDVETLALSNALTIRHHNPSGNLFETAMIMYANGGTIINYDGSGRLSTTSAGASITGSLNITSAITHNTHGTILDSSANLTNINNVYASGYRIGSTTVIDSSRNLTNIGTISSGAITTTDILTVNTDDFNYGIKVAQATGTGYAPASILLEATQAGSRGQGIYHYNTVNDKTWFTGTFYNNSSNSWGVAYASQTSFNSNIAQLANAKLIVTTGGSVGIGTTSPNAKLEINDTSSADSTGLIIANGFTTDAANDASEIMFRLYRSYTPSLNDAAFVKAVKEQAWDSSGDRDASLTFGTRSGGTEPTERMRIDSSGNIGIGTTSPARTLDVSGDMRIIDSGANTGLRITTDNDREAYIILGDTDDASMGGIAYNNSTNVLSIDCNNAERMTINSSGNVGIGTTSPNFLLDVESSTAEARLYNTSTSATFYIVSGGTTNISQLYFGDSGANGQGKIRYRNSGDSMAFETNATEAVRIDSSQRVGIGTSSPSGKLMVREDTGGSPTRIIVSNGGSVQSGTSSRLSFYEGTTEKSYIERRRDGSGQTAFVTPADDNPFVWENASGEFMRFTSSNVGIGTTSPSEKLHVIGNILTSGGVKVGDSSADALHFFGILKQGSGSGTTVMDSSRNLQNLESIVMPDSKIIKLGTGLDLQIYHNGTDSFINNDTGTLFIKQFANDGDIKILSDDGSGNTTEYIRCDGGLGQVKLFHYGSEKFITTSAGIKVTGEVNLTGELEINGTDVIDSSRNLTNIGTISSTNITSNGSAVVVQSKPLTVVGQPINISAPNSAEMKFLQTTSSTTASKGSIQWFDSNSNSCGTINLKADGAEDNSGVMEFYVTAQTDELGDDPFGINKMMTITENGVTVHGSLSKSSGSFRIDHPLKPETHDLVHSFVESPQADNIYSGEIELVDGRAEINLDIEFNMTEGTVVALNRGFRTFTTNESDWDNVKGSVADNILTIVCQNPESNAKVSWLVIGERQDKEIHESSLTDDHGKVIVEPLKVG